MNDEMTAPLFVFIKLRSIEGNEDEILRALARVVGASRSEAGCIGIDAFRSPTDPRSFFIHSVWKDADAFDRHAEMPHTVEFMNTVDRLLESPREVTRTRKIT